MPVITTTTYADDDTSSRMHSTVTSVTAPVHATSRPAPVTVEPKTAHRVRTSSLKASSPVATAPAPSPLPVVASHVQDLTASSAAAPATRAPIAPRTPQAPLGGLSGVGGSATFTFAAALFAALLSLFALAHPRTSRRLRLAIDLLVVTPARAPLEHPG